DHDVELLVASGREIDALSSEWMRIYESSGVAIRVLEPVAGVRPAYLAPTLEVFNALRERPPEVAIVNDWRGLGYAALRARQVGRALRETAFVVNCHGPARVLAAFAQKVPDALAQLEPDLLDRIDLIFLGSESKRWTRDKIASSLSSGVSDRVASIRIETELEREAALEELHEGGTLAVMPSLLDNSPNTVGEC